MIRFLGRPEQRKLFLDLTPETRETFFSGFKVAVLEFMRYHTAEEINEVLTQVDKDYDEIVATGINAPKQRV